MRGFYAKWGQYWARLALILHLLKWAEGQVVDPARVDGPTATAASQLMDYFVGMARKVLPTLGITDATDGPDGVRRGCQRCGTDLRGRQRTAKFCSDNCRKRTHDRRGR
jgi:hypothetical protein